MKATLSIVLALCAVSPASAQFNIISENRFVRAHAEYTHEISEPPKIREEIISDTQFEAAQPLMPFDASVTANVVADRPDTGGMGTAFQTSHFSPTEIFASGGTTNVESRGSSSKVGRVGVRSNFDVQFTLDVPAYVRVEFEIIDRGLVRHSGFPCPILCEYSGSASLEIAGPSVNLVVPANDAVSTCVRTDSSTCIWTPSIDPVTLDRTLRFEVGDYRILALASSSPVGTEEGQRPSDVSYTVRLTAVPIPEPSTLLVLLLALPFWKLTQVKRQR
jgi:hypothetical protein